MGLNRNVGTATRYPRFPLDDPFCYPWNLEDRSAHDEYSPTSATSLLVQHFFSRVFSLPRQLDPKRRRRSLFIESPGIGVDSSGRLSRRGVYSPLILLPSNLPKRLCRSSGSSLSLKTFPDDVYTSYKISAATAGSYHLRTLFLVVLSKLVITQSLLQIFHMCGKASTTTSKCVSNTRESR